MAACPTRADGDDASARRSEQAKQKAWLGVAHARPLAFALEHAARAADAVRGARAAAARPLAASERSHALALTPAGSSRCAARSRPASHPHTASKTRCLQLHQGASAMRCGAPRTAVHRLKVTAMLRLHTRAALRAPSRCCSPFLCVLRAAAGVRDSAAGPAASRVTAGRAGRAAQQRDTCGEALAAYLFARRLPCPRTAAAAHT